PPTVLLKRSPATPPIGGSSRPTTRGGSSPPVPLSLRERGREGCLEFPLSGTERGSGGEDRLEPIASLHEGAPRGRVAVGAGQVEAEGVGQPVVDVEQHAGVNRIFDGVIAHTGGAQRGHVSGTLLSGREGELLEETECRAQLRVERRGAPILQHRRDQCVV